MSSWLNKNRMIRTRVFKDIPTNNTDNNSLDIYSYIQPYRKIRNIAYLSLHPGLVNGEVKILKDLGYKIYIPKKDNQCEDNINIYRNTDLNNDKLDILDSFNPYIDIPSDIIIDIILENFDIIFVTLLSMNIVHKIALKSNKPIIIRIFGKAGNYNYEDSYKEIAKYPNVYFGMGYKEMLEIEPVHSIHKYIYLPLPPNYYFEPYYNTWRNKTNKIMTVCSYIDESEYYKNIYNNFKKTFGDLPHVIYGRHGIMDGVISPLGETIKNDNCIIPNASLDIYTKAFQDNNVLYYHSIEPRHIHYHPIEAIMIGMPVIFLHNSLLDTLTDKNSNGRCKNDIEAKEKILRIIIHFCDIDNNLQK